MIDFGETELDASLRFVPRPVAPNLQARYHDGRSDDLGTAVANILAWTGPDD